MEMIVRNNADGRRAMIKAAESAGISLTQMGKLSGVGLGSVVRFAHNAARSEAGGTVGKMIDANCHLLTFIRALDAAGYEVVVRPKVTGSRRERRLKALRERNNGQETAPSS